MKHSFFMLVPAHACAGAERFGNSRNSGKRAESQLESPGNVSRTVFVHQCERLFVAETELARALVIGDVASSSLRSQPFADITFIRAGPGGKLRGAHRTFGQSLIQSQLFSNYDHAGVDRGSKVTHKLPDESIQLICIDCHLNSPFRFVPSF